MSKLYQLDMTRMSFFTIFVEAETEAEARMLAENGDYEEHYIETEVEIGECYCEEVAS